MDGVPTKHKVRTSVCFAPTPPFVRAFGKAEAQRQQQAFERPSWVKSEGVSACTPTTHEEISLQVGGALACGAAFGLLLGVVVMLVFFDVRSK